MSVSNIRSVLEERAALAGLQIPDALVTQLAAYYGLLTRWNQKINLTSLLDSTEAVDRLLLEPVAAAAHLPERPDLIDLGSGGGSPAVPLALALGAPRLVMVESRVRKAAFLREALRELGLKGTVETARFEDVADRVDSTGRFGVVSVRAVRLDASVFSAVWALLQPGGVAALFRTVDDKNPPDELPASLSVASTNPLVPSSRSVLTVLRQA